MKTNNPHQKPRSHSIVSSFAPFAWPVVTIILFFSFRMPLIALLSTATRTIDKSSKITIHGFSVESERKLNELASTEVKSAILNVSTFALRELMDMSPQSRMKPNPDYFNRKRAVWDELTAAKLAYYRDLEPSANIGEYTFEVGRTHLGEATNSYLREIVLEQALGTLKSK
ncbi:hypothetical protein OH491_19135 [Termitidicoccus mucosus]|uniref:hypothetical protein n=1 Tax=Termitidicoccus mucosus TaxID=1184151 RepID=UPI0011AB5E01